MIRAGSTASGSKSASRLLFPGRHPTFNSPERRTLQPDERKSYDMYPTVRKVARARVVLALVLIVLTSAIAFSQQRSESSITGIVKDPNGAIVSGAEVSLLHAQSVLRTTQTTSDGKFTIEKVGPGSYAVIVSKSGFGRFSTAVQLKPGDKRELNV